MRGGRGPYRSRRPPCCRAPPETGRASRRTRSARPRRTGWAGCAPEHRARSWPARSRTRARQPGPASCRGRRRRRAAATTRGPPKAIEVDRVREGSDATRPRANIEPLLEQHRLNATRVRNRPRQEVDVRGPAETGHQWGVAYLLQQIANDRDPNQTKRPERVGHTRDVHERTEQPWGDSTQPPYGDWRVRHGGSLTNDDIGAALEPLHQFRNVLGLV